MPVCRAHRGGDRAAVEWWASFIEAGQAITLAGATVLRFDSPCLVVDHVDYWRVDRRHDQITDFTGDTPAANAIESIRASHWLWRRSSSGSNTVWRAI